MPGFCAQKTHEELGNWGSGLAPQESHGVEYQREKAYEVRVPGRSTAREEMSCSKRQLVGQARFTYRAEESRELAGYPNAHRKNWPSSFPVRQQSA